MADIAKCTGGQCPLKEKCYRYTATEDEYWQSWLVEEPYDYDKKECEFFYERKQNYEKTAKRR